MFEKFGIHGYANIEEYILTPLLTRDPVLLIGDSGAAKTKVVRILGEIISKIINRKYKTSWETKIINAKTANPENWVGFPIPPRDSESKEMDIYYSKDSLVKAIVCATDEINRAESSGNQNKLLSLIADREVDGIKLPVTFLYGMMNPYGVDENAEYDGVEPLEKALAERFSMILTIPSLQMMSSEDIRGVARASRPRANADVMKTGEVGRKDVEITESILDTFEDFWVKSEEFYIDAEKQHSERIAKFIQAFEEKIRPVTKIQGRRIGFIQRSILGLYAIRRTRGIDDLTSAVYDALKVSFADETYKASVDQRKIRAAYDAVSHIIQSNSKEKVRKVLEERNILKRVSLAVELGCDPVDTGRFLNDYLTEVWSDNSDFIKGAVASFVFFDYFKQKDVIPVPDISALARTVKKVIDSFADQNQTLGIIRFSNPEEVLSLQTELADLKLTQRGKLTILISNYAQKSLFGSLSGIATDNYLSILKEVTDEFFKYNHIIGGKNDIQQ